jgi:hypothetical protein
MSVSYLTPLGMTVTEVYKEALTTVGPGQLLEEKAGGGDRGQG